MVGVCQRPEMGEVELVTIFPAMLRTSKTVQSLIEPELDGKNWGVAKVTELVDTFCLNAY